MILAWFGLSYGALLAAPTLWLALLATISLALAAAAIGFGVFHDANHGTLFRRPAANLAAARLCSVLLGPSRHFWVFKHQGLHHRQPNVFGWDDDLETRGMLRFSPLSAWHPRFRHQQVKAVLYYGLNTLEWLFWKDFRCLANGSLNEWHTLNLGRPGARGTAAKQGPVRPAVRPAAVPPLAAAVGDRRVLSLSLPVELAAGDRLPGRASHSRNGVRGRSRRGRLGDASAPHDGRLRHLLAPDDLVHRRPEPPDRASSVPECGALALSRAAADRPRRRRAPGPRVPRSGRDFTPPGSISSC